MPENYDVRIEDLALKEFQSLPKSFIKRIFSKIESLRTNPRPAGCSKLTGFNDLYRIRSGDYRIVYSIHDAARKVVIFRIRHRKDAYKRL